MIILVKGRQRIGKTTWAVGLAVNYVENGGYSTGEIVSNIHLYYENGKELNGYHYLTNKQMRSFIGQMVDRGARHLIVIVDEIDRVFSHRTWHNAEQVEQLTGLWQDEKLGFVIIGTAHLGLSVDSLIREIAQIEIIVSEKNFVGDYILSWCLNALNKEVFMQKMSNMSLVQKLFNSWEPVK